MESITIYPKNEKQRSLLTSLLEELKIHFETDLEDANSLLTAKEFYAKIDRSKKQAEVGKTKIVSKENQKELLGL